ncbi:MAG TPA: hypothetical protein VKU36_05315 [Candidatus Babeliales bacterium]|nr:hypothetical protein [Candidatus Babeliales bacterium]
MKSLKNVIFSLVILAGVITLSMHAANDPNFEIYNKSKEDIKVVIATAGERTMDPVKREIRITSNKKEQTVAKESTWRETLPSTLAGVGVMVVDSDGKHEFNVQREDATETIYLSWNPEKSTALYPQTGPLMGLLGKTKSGLSLKNNISSNQIKQVKP